MLDIMTKCKNAIEAYNTALSIYSSNIANMSVTGYKRLDISFQSVLERLLSGGSAANMFEGMGGTNPVQLGQGSAIGNVRLDFSQGTFSSASYLDLAISGAGLFIVSPDGGETRLYTRAGKFHFDTDGYMRNEQGMLVYGYGLSSGGTPVGDIEPIRISDPIVPRNLLSWTNDGKLAQFPEAVADDGVTLLGYPDTSKPPVDEFYQISLTYFANPSGLEQAQGTTFKDSLASGPPQGYGPPDSGPVGRVYARQLEQSNVFYLEETINSLEIQRAMSGNLTMVRMASDIINSFIQRLS